VRARQWLRLGIAGLALSTVLTAVADVTTKAIDLRMFFMLFS
jgi:hypothetical protein